MSTPGRSKAHLRSPEALEWYESNHFTAEKCRGSSAAPSQNCPTPEGGGDPSDAAVISKGYILLGLGFVYDLRHFDISSHLNLGNRQIRIN